MLATIIISIIVLGLLILASVKTIKDNKKGGCGCGCEHCSQAKNCHK